MGRRKVEGGFVASALPYPVIKKPPKLGGFCVLSGVLSLLLCMIHVYALFSVEHEHDAGQH